MIVAEIKSEVIWGWEMWNNEHGVRINDFEVAENLFVDMSDINWKQSLAVYVEVLFVQKPFQ